MQLHQIRYFLALCEEYNFTRAARRSGVSQPSLTNAISALEEELGGALFQRRPLVLTTLGRAVQPYFKQIAESADHVQAVARALTDVAPCTPQYEDPHAPVGRAAVDCFTDHKRKARAVRERSRAKDAFEG